MTQVAKSAYHHGDLRAKLVDLAVAEIAAGNGSQLSLRGLARKAGVSAAAPYHHFKNKEELLAAVAEDGFANMAREMDRQVQLLGPTPEEIDVVGAMGKGYVLFAAAHPAHFHAMFLPELQAPEAPCDLEAAADSCFGRLLQSVERLLGADATPEKVRDVALTAWATVHGAAILWANGTLNHKIGGLNVESVAEIVTSLARRFMGPPFSP